MFGFFAKIFGDENDRKLKPFYALVEKINTLEPEFEKLSDEELRGKTAKFKERIANGDSLDSILSEAFALVRQAAVRTLGERHYDVQLIGGMILHGSKIAEMKTGEGKTLVATLPAYLNALTEKGVHIVTVNDYLSRRDAVWMGQIYSFLGLSVGVINHESSYLYDPGHTTANQNAKIKNQNDSPKTENELDKKRDEIGSFKVVYEFLRPCSRREAYQADITYGTNHEFGFDYLRDNLEYEAGAIRQRDFNYAIVDEIDSILIDEARTPLIISAPTTQSEDLYRRFAQIAGKLESPADYAIDEKLKAITLTGLGIDKAEKLLNIDNIYTEGGIKYVHHLETAIRAKALFKKDVEYVVRDNEVIIVDQFTGRLQPGRRWSEGLHQAIEAKEDVSIQKESRTFASITFQNYFRLYKKLSGMTGTAMTSAEEFLKVYGLDVVAVPTNQRVARIDHNDLIFQTEVGKFKAVARAVKELHSKGQPVLVGTVSVEKNELLSSYLSQVGVPYQVLNAKNHEREGEIIAQAGKKGAVTIATNMAGRGVDIKLGGNPATQEQSDLVRQVGGLFVLGTERHEARRIDNQLRGRSGRQGDLGATQFFVSLEDPLLRVFASETIKKMMGRLGVAEDEPIENRLITKSLENAQTKIEGLNFDSRKHVLEFDDVLNLHRKTIYNRRRKLLVGDSAAVSDVFDEMSAGEPEDVMGKIAEKRQVLGEEAFLQIVRRLMLQTIDTYWVEHLEVMDYLRSSVNLRAYGQRDPLVEYKKEGLRLFRELEESIREQVLELIPKLNTEGIKSEVPLVLREVHDEARAITASPKSVNQVSSIPKVGRNDPCLCGSGKKYKKCHGK
jgi:preprotein translocase subunit SecA